MSMTANRDHRNHTDNQVCGNHKSWDRIPGAPLFTGCRRRSTAVAGAAAAKRPAPGTPARPPPRPPGNRSSTRPWRPPGTPARPRCPTTGWPTTGEPGSILGWPGGYCFSSPFRRPRRWRSSAAGSCRPIPCHRIYDRLQKRIADKKINNFS